MKSELDVLVVDDDPDIRALLVLLLEEHDLVVQTARNGREAYEPAVVLRPRLVLSDLMMPVIHGDALYAALQGNAATADVTFVLMTSIPAKAPSAIARVVGKPIELAALEVLLGRSAPPGRARGAAVGHAVHPASDGLGLCAPGASDCISL